jgi:hypothetical protein
MHHAFFFGGRLLCKRKDSHVADLRRIAEKYDNVTFFASIDSTNYEGSETITDAFADELPIVMNVERANYTDAYNKLYEVHNKRNVYSMYYHNKRCTEMITSYSHTFDVVVKYRPDLENRQVMPIVDVVEEDTLYVPCGADYGGLNDQVAYGSMDVMTRYGTCVDHIPEYVSGGSAFHPETLLKKHVQYTCKFKNVVRFPWTYAIHQK